MSIESNVGSRAATWYWFAHDILAAMGAPTTEQNIQVMVTWFAAEEPPGSTHNGAFNPLNYKKTDTTTGEVGFGSWQEGVDAIASDLLHTRYASKAAIAQAFIRGASPTEILTAIQDSPWASGHYNHQLPAHFATTLANWDQYRSAPVTGSGGVYGGTSSGVNTTASGGVPDSYSGAPPDVAAPDEDILNYLRTHYGFMAWALDDPEVAKTLLDAYRAGNDSAQLQAAFQQTDWWRNHSGTMRQWDDLFHNDPATAGQQLRDRISEVQRSASTLGVTLDQERAQLIAWNSLRMAWSADDIQRALLAEGTWNGKAPGQLGTIGRVEDDIRTRAADWGLQVTQDDVTSWARRVLTGYTTVDNLEQLFKGRAKAMFPAFASDIDNGATVRDIAQPYLQTASQLLEVSPGTIHLWDPKFSRPLTQRVNGKAQPMSLDEWQQTLMSDPRYGWDRTRNAKQDAYGLLSQIGTTMGVMA